MRVLIDGEPREAGAATISVFDWGLLRGDGCFEAIHSYAGTPFAVGEHLDRLEASAAILGLPLPPRRALAGWIAAVAAEGGDCIVRLIVTRGSPEPADGAPSRCVVLWEPRPELPDRLRLEPRRAPWHSGGDPSELTGAKSLSYGPNVAAMRAAQANGFHDALLISREGWILEGPTFTLAWFHGGALETPSLDLDILKSITRAKALELAAGLGLEVREGRYRLDRLAEADEVCVFSTVKEVAPVSAVGDLQFEPGPLTAKLAAAFADLVAGSTGS